jgi:hypothetical protein
MSIISNTLKLDGVDKLYFFPDSLAIGTIDKFEYLANGLLKNTWRPNAPVGPLLWSPALIDTEGWWDASDLSTITVISNEVRVLAEKTGNSPDLTAYAGFAPATGTYTLNGLNMLYYDGTEAMATYDGDFVVPSSGNFSVFQVGEVFLPLENVADGMYAMLDPSGADWQFVGGVNVNDWNGRLVVSELGGTNTNYASPMGIGGAIYNTVFNFDESRVDGYVTGDFREGTTYTAKPTSPQTFIVMSNRVGNALAGHVGETIIVEDVTEATRQKIEGYLAWKWGLQNNLPVGHPYEFTPPTVQSDAVLDENGDPILDENGDPITIT